MDELSKQALVQELRAEVARAAAVNEKAARDAREAATHEESKPENDKDTRGIEAAYLAGAQAERARDLERVGASLASLDLRPFGPGERIAAGALIELDRDGAALFYFLAPQGGGMRARVGEVEVQVITPQSPLGRELLGKTEGDAVELRMQGRVRAYEIVRVR